MKIKKVILHIESSSGYGRNLLRGIVEYARCFGPWEFHRISPFYHRGQETMNGQRILDRAQAVIRRGSTDALAIDDDVVAEAIWYIRRNIRTKIHTHDIVKTLSISRSELYSRFRRVLDKSIYQVIVQEKINEMSRLLKETDLTIRQIAYAMGEDDDKNISRLFTREIGLTPSAFRKCNR